MQLFVSKMNRAKQLERFEGVLSIELHLKKLRFKCQINLIKLHWAFQDVSSTKPSLTRSFPPDRLQSLPLSDVILSVRFLVSLMTLARDISSRQLGASTALLSERLARYGIGQSRNSCCTLGSRKEVHYRVSSVRAMRALLALLRNGDDESTGRRSFIASGDRHVPFCRVCKLVNYHDRARRSMMLTLVMFIARPRLRFRTSLSTVIPVERGARSVCDKY